MTLQDLMNEGWVITVKFQANGREIGMIYEASMYHAHKNKGEKFEYRAFGNSLDELAERLQFQVFEYREEMRNNRNKNLLSGDKPL